MSLTRAINAGMSEDVFSQFMTQLRRYVRERLVPAEDETVEADCVPDDILAEMKEMGLFGVTIPEEFGGSGFNTHQYIAFIQELSWALPAFRSIISMTEPDSGSDAAALTTRAIRDGDDYILNGSKRYISNAPFAHMGMIMARTSAENLPKNEHVSAFLVPFDLPGVTIGKPDKTRVLRRRCIPLIMDGCLWPRLLRDMPSVCSIMR